MMAYSPQSDTIENTGKMTRALKKVVSGNVTHAVKDTDIDGMEIHEGDIIGVSAGHIHCSEKDKFTAVVSLVKAIADEDSELITLYYGEGESEDDAVKRLKESYSSAYTETFGAGPIPGYGISIPAEINAADKAAQAREDAKRVRG